MTELLTPLGNATDRAKAGAEMLDRRLPGWDKRINTDRLDIADGSMCVLGQIGLWGGAERLGCPDTRLENHASRTRWMRRHGFCSYPPSYDDDPFYSELTVAWRELISSRN